MALSSETCSGVQCPWGSAERGTICVATKDPHFPARVQDSRVTLSGRGLGASHGPVWSKPAGLPGPQSGLHSVTALQFLPEPVRQLRVNTDSVENEVVEECTCSAVQCQLRLRLGDQP